MKGSLFDIAFIGISVVVLMLFVLIGGLILDKFGTKASESGNRTLNASYFDKGESALGVFNYGVIMIFIMGVIAAVVLAVYMDVNPVVIGISILIMIIIVAIPFPILSNLYTDIAGTGELSDIAGGYTIAEVLISNMPLFIAISCCVVIVALYIKRREEVSA